MKAIEIMPAFERAFSKGFTSMMKSAITPPKSNSIADKSRRRNRGGTQTAKSSGDGLSQTHSHLEEALNPGITITKEPFVAQHERSDTCTVPAAGVIGESMVDWSRSRLLESSAAIRWMNLAQLFGIHGATACVLRQNLIMLRPIVLPGDEVLEKSAEIVTNITDVIFSW